MQRSFTVIINVVISVRLLIDWSELGTLGTVQFIHTHLVRLSYSSGARAADVVVIRKV